MDTTWVEFDDEEHPIDVLEILQASGSIANEHGFYNLSASDRFGLLEARDAVKAYRAINE